MATTRSEDRPTEPPARLAEWRVLGASLLVLVIFVAAFALLPLDPAITWTRLQIEAAGTFGPVVFVAAIAIAVIIPPIPEHALILTAGLLFPPAEAALLVIVGATVGATVNFGIGRWVRRSAVVQRDRVRRAIIRMAPLTRWPTIVIVRMFAGVTFDWYSYALGVLGTRTHVFVTATIVGIAPGTTLEVYGGSYAASAPWVTLGIGAALALISFVVYRRFPSRFLGVTDRADHDSSASTGEQREHERT